jgi:hypothetical protein
MAIIKDNYVMHGASGGVGDDYVFKFYKKTGKTAITKRPRPSRFKASKKQANRRNKFAEAVKFAQDIMKDPVRAKSLDLKKHRSLYGAAIAAFMADKRSRSTILKDPKYAIKQVPEDPKTSRQRKAIAYARKNGIINNAEYQRVAKVSKPTATRDLADLVKRKILKRSGTHGAGAFYKIIGSAKN